MSEALTNYKSIISILQDVKLCEGPLALSQTLKRHPEVKKWLHNFQSKALSEIEKELVF